jgi:hypothetical protein
MDCKITPEICATISTTINSLFYKIGLPLIAILVFFVLFLYWSMKHLINQEIMKYKTELDKNKIKNIELWKQQKELMFDFVRFLEEKVFNNPELKKTNNNEEKSKIFAELNKYYGQLYLVMETDILEKINKYMNNTVSPVQRFYLYKELRKQLMIIIYGEFTDKDCPFICIDSALVTDENNDQKTISDIKKIKIAYPFIEETEGGYKTIPFFAEGKK